MNWQLGHDPLSTSSMSEAGVARTMETRAAGGTEKDIREKAQVPTRISTEWDLVEGILDTEGLCTYITCKPLHG